MDRKSPSITVVIPVYNSSSSLIELTERIDRTFAAHSEFDYEIIFVDDSPVVHKTWDTLEGLSTRYQTVRAIKLGRNFGQASALLCGMSFARGDWIVTMDDDLQHRPEDIPLLLEKKNHDVVIAQFPEKECSKSKKITSNIVQQFGIILLNKPRTLISSPFRLIKKRVVEQILEIKTSRPFLLAMLLSVTSDIVNVDVTHLKRRYGKSNYTFRKSTSLFSNMIFNNSSFMLRVMSLSGFILSSLSTLYGCILIIKKLSGNYIIPGWTSMMVVLLISTGVIIFSLGVIGEYIARLLETAENQPTWAISKLVNFSLHDEYKEK